MYQTAAEIIAPDEEDFRREMAAILSPETRKKKGESKYTQCRILIGVKF